MSRGGQNGVYAGVLELDYIALPDHHHSPILQVPLSLSAVPVHWPRCIRPKQQTALPQALATDALLQARSTTLTTAANNWLDEPTIATGWLPEPRANREGRQIAEG